MWRPSTGTWRRSALSGCGHSNGHLTDLFAFGIDPVGRWIAVRHPADWPSAEEVESYNRRLRSELTNASNMLWSGPRKGHPQMISMLEVAVEHRLMHAERWRTCCTACRAERKIKYQEHPHGKPTA